MKISFATAAVLAVSACASAPVVADLRPTYEAQREAALAEMLNCTDVSDIVCQCRGEGLSQEFAEPSLARFDQGYAALATYWDDPAHKQHTAEQAEIYAVRTIFTAIKADVEDICSYHEEEASS